MAVTSKIARIRVGPNARNKTTLYTATKVTGPTGNPPQYSTQIIQYSDAKGSNGVVIGTQDENNPGKITWNDNASATEKKYQTFILKASTTQVNSVKDDIATTAQEKAALNAVSGSNNAAVNSGTDSAKPAASKSDLRREWDPNFGQGQRDDFDPSSENVGTSTDASQPAAAAAGTRNDFGSVLVYPSTLRQSKQDTIWFTMMKYQTKELGPSNGMLSAGERNANRKSIGKVVLPIPGGINDNNTTDWSTGTMNAAQMALAKLALTGITKGLEKAGEEGASILKDIGLYVLAYSSFFL